MIRVLAYILSILVLINFTGIGSGSYVLTEIFTLNEVLNLQWKWVSVPANQRGDMQVRPEPNYLNGNRTYVY